MQANRDAPGIGHSQFDQRAVGVGALDVGENQVCPEQPLPITLEDLGVQRVDRQAVKTNDAPLLTEAVSVVAVGTAVIARYEERTAIDVRAAIDLQARI